MTEWRCVEMNCGAYAVNMDEMLCAWHDENRLSDQGERRMTISDKEERIIMTVVEAFMIISVDFNRDDDRESVKELTEVLGKWRKLRSDEFRALFADTVRNLDDLIRYAIGE